MPNDTDTTPETTDATDDRPMHCGKRLGAEGSLVGYSVEGRVDYLAPETVAGTLLDNRWRPINFHPSPIGVPAGPRYHAHVLDQLHLLSYPAAQALRWWFHAQAEAEGVHHCLETRIVEHECTYSHWKKATKVHAEIGGDDRSSVMPDWAK